MKNVTDTILSLRAVMPKDWRRKHYSALCCHIVIRASLFLFASSHLWYLTSLYLADSITVVTNASFHTEQKPINLPGFLLCFSKLFTYKNLREQDIQYLYSPSMQTRTSENNKSTYDWKISINDLLMGVEFNGTSYKPSAFFQSTFYLPTQSCWRTRRYKFLVRHAGQVSPLNLFINAAVYEDLATYYKSPLTYLTVVPFLFPRVREDGIPQFRSSVHISPGTLSAVGFHLKKVDSTHRSKHDVRKCAKNKISKENCISLLYRKLLDKKCNINVTSSVTSVPFFSSCGHNVPVDVEECLVEPCSEDLFYFTKSEAYIKFDSRLSTLGVSPTYMVDMKKQLTSAKSMDTKYNPETTKSFRKIATGMDYLSEKVAEAISKPKGFKCDRLLTRRIPLITTKGVIPSVTAERELLNSQMKTLVAQFDQTIRGLTKQFLKYQSKAPHFQNHTPTFLPRVIKNTKSVTTTKWLKDTISPLGTLLDTFSLALNFLVQQTVSMAGTYENLQFSRFIKRYSSYESLVTYRSLLQATIGSIKLLGSLLFEGTDTELYYFAHQDDRIKTTYKRIPHFSTVADSRVLAAVADAYPDDELAKYAWLLNKGFISSQPTPVFEAVHGFNPRYQRVAIVPHLYCLFYSNYVQVTEEFHGCEQSFSMGSFSSRFSMTDQVSKYFLNALFEEYETATFFVIGNDGIDRALRRSCSRLGRYPLYLETNATYREASSEFQDVLHHYYGIRNEYKSDRLRLLVKMIRSTLFGFFDYVEESQAFLAYYSHRITESFGSMIADVENLKLTFSLFHKFEHQNQNHKRFLVKRIRTVAQLIHGTLDGDGEETISHYLDKKGKILIGEVQLEMAAMVQELQTARLEFLDYRSGINSVALTYANNGSLAGVIIHAVMTANFHRDPKVQQWILQTLQDCNTNRWKITNHDLSHRLSIMSDWSKNATSLVVRAKRYVDSLEISQSFLRKNMMHVSLYYDSMTVMTETNEPSHKVQTLVSNFGAVMRIYLRMNTFRILNAILFVVTFCLARLT